MNSNIHFSPFHSEKKQQKMHTNTWNWINKWIKLRLWIQRIQTGIVEQKQKQIENEEREECKFLSKRAWKRMNRNVKVQNENVPEWRVSFWSKENVTLEVKEEEKKREYNDNEKWEKKLEAERERERERGNGRRRAAFRNNKWMKVDTSAWKFLSRINKSFICQNKVSINSFQTKISLRQSKFCQKCIYKIWLKYYKLFVLYSFFNTLKWNIFNKSNLSRIRRITII